MKQLQKKNPGIRPIILEGKALANTWWGKAWNKNLETYADYSNRIGRGRSYVRHLAVLDLKIKPGKVNSLVQGSVRNPYKVSIVFQKIEKKNWQSIKEMCLSHLSSLPDLLAGKFPKVLRDAFMVQGKGLFPAPSEISFDCNCPDGASMCKHVAATFYGVGSRLDEDPSLFFTLRKADIGELVSHAVQSRAASIIDTPEIASSRVIADDKLSDLFGLDMDGLSPVKPTGKSAERSKKGMKANTIDLQGFSTGIALVAHYVNTSKGEVSIKSLEKSTGFSTKKLYGILFRLKKQGKVKNPARGIYIKPSSKSKN